MREVNTENNNDPESNEETYLGDDAAEVQKGELKLVTPARYEHKRPFHTESLTSLALSAVHFSN